jgi:hypothetical protein
MLVLCFLTSCIGQEFSTATPQKTPKAISTQSTQVFFPTPVITTTPIDMVPKSEDELGKIVDAKYGINPKCRIDLLHSKEEYSQVPYLELITGHNFSPIG